MGDTATHCNTLQHTATHCNTLQMASNGRLQMKRGGSVLLAGWLKRDPSMSWVTLTVQSCRRCVLCCSVLQCVAVCRSVLQCVAVCCNLSWVTLASHAKLQEACAFCSVLQCVAVCCSVFWCIAVWCSVLQYVICHISRAQLQEACAFYNVL